MNAPDHRDFPATTLNAEQARAQIDAQWDQDIVPELERYIAIPCKSPAFDPAWAEHGHIEAAVLQALSWVQAQRIAGLRIEVIRLSGRTPVLWFELPASGTAVDGTMLIYGHLDKQPEFSGWRSGFGPWTPRYVDGKLYGRGGADDGYAIYAAVAAIKAIQSQGSAHPRIVGLIETCEESGSYDLPAYIEALKERMGEVALVACLDSGCGNYDQLWITSSLRGMAAGVLKVEVLTEGVHSGDASGVVPSSFRILRTLLDRLEDSRTGRLLPASFYCDMPPDRVAQTRQTAAILGADAYRRFPWACADDGAFTLPMTDDPEQALINRTWRPTLSVTGAEGLPELRNAGNVLRPFTAFKLSLRLPPLVDAAAATAELKALLEADAPYHARVTFHPEGNATGWNAPVTAPWLERALGEASQLHFGAPCAYIGQGGTIPLMNMLQQGFPAAQMMVCGVLGPQSNAHGPNEFLHVPYAKRLTAALAHVLSAFAHG